MNTEDCTAPDIAFDCYGALEDPRYHAVDEIESQSGVPLAELGGHEGFEDLVAQLNRDAYAIVGHAEVNRGFAALQGDHDATVLAAFEPMADRVGQKIGDDLFETHRIAE